MVKILVTGTPGTGKTTFSKKISTELSLKMFTLSEIIREHKLYSEFDEDYDSFIYDTKTVTKALKNKILPEDDYLIDSHSTDLIEDMEFDKIYVIRCNTETLYERLLLRGYRAAKIQENVDCEIFDECGQDLCDIFGEDNVIYLSGCEKDDELVTTTEELENLKNLYKK